MSDHRPRRVRRLILLAFLTAVLMPVFLSACNSGGTKENADVTRGYSFAVLSEPLPKPDFTLTDTSGQPFDFRKETEGYVTLLYFGYTNCPDICPVHMANLGAVLDSLDSDVVRQTKVVFVTTDPERDTPERLRKWLDRFDPDFIGLTGTQEQVKQAQLAAAVAPAEKEATEKESYGVSHAAYLIAYSKDNQAHLLYPSGVRQRDWANDLPRLVKEDWK